jgi:hypothetical protein
MIVSKYFVGGGLWRLSVLFIALTPDCMHWVFLLVSIQTVFKINTIIYRNKLFTDEFHCLKWIIKCTYFVGGGLWRLLNINLVITSARPLKSIFSLFWLYIWYHYVYIHNLYILWFISSNEIHYGTYSPQFFLSRWHRTACTEFFSRFQYKLYLK